MLGIESPEELEPAKKPLIKQRGKKFLKNKIKYFIQMTRDKRTSFLSVVQKMMSRMRRTVSIFGEEDESEHHLDTLESDLERKITEIRKKIKFGKESSEREKEINQRRLEVLEGMKQKQQMEHTFRRLLDDILMGGS